MVQKEADTRMTGTEDFIKIHGKDLFLEVMSHATDHLNMCQKDAPEDEEQRLYFTLLKFIDFECWDYGDAPKGITEQQVIQFLTDHRSQVTCEPPTYLGLFAGRFSFMWPEGAAKNPKKVPE